MTAVTCAFSLLFNRCLVNEHNPCWLSQTNCHVQLPPSNDKRQRQTTNYYVCSSDVHYHTSLPIFLSSGLSTSPTRCNCSPNHRTRRNFNMACWNSANGDMVLILSIYSSLAPPTQFAFVRNTSNFPAQITNPIGQVVLGFNESNSLNLDLSE